MTLFHYNTFSFTLNIKNVTSQHLYSYIQQGPLSIKIVFYLPFFKFFFKQASNFLLKNAARHSAVTLSRFFFFFNAVKQIYTKNNTQTDTHRKKKSCRLRLNTEILHLFCLNLIRRLVFTQS